MKLRWLMINDDIDNTSDYNQWFEFLILLNSDAWSLEMFLWEQYSPWSPSIGDLTDFFRVEILPHLVVKLLVESMNSVQSLHVNECVPNIAFVLENQ